MAESITLEGLPGLKRALAKKAAEMRAAAELAVAAEAELVSADARKAAPYLDADDPDGHIRDGITMEVEGARAVVTSTNRHGAFEEFGTTRNAPQPFMTPTAEKSRLRFPRRAADIFKEVIG